MVTALRQVFISTRPGAFNARRERKPWCCVRNGSLVEDVVFEKDLDLSIHALDKRLWFGRMSNARPSDYSVYVEQEENGETSRRDQEDFRANFECT